MINTLKRWFAGALSAEWRGTPRDSHLVLSRTPIVGERLLIGESCQTMITLLCVTHVSDDVMIVKQEATDLYWSLKYTVRQP